MPYNTPWHATTTSAANYSYPQQTNIPNLGQMLSTSSTLFTQPSIEWAPPMAHAETVSVLADGSLLILAGGVRVRVSVHLFKDLVTLAEMELVKRLAPEPVEAEG